jgi:uncharacterized iron-regulated protein
MKKTSLFTGISGRLQDKAAVNWEVKLLNHYASLLTGTHIRLILIAFLCGFWVSGGVASAQQQPSLVGKIWSVRSETFVQPEQLSHKLESGSWLFLGEQHDHPDHQRLATDWLKKLDAQNRLGVLALEMARQSQQQQLDAALGGEEVAPESLNWSEGWPWQRYAELIREGLIRSQRVVGTDLDRDQQLQAYREGAARPAVSEAQAVALDELIYQGHCEVLPREQLPQMRQVQLARDQAMAEVLARFSGAEGVSLFVTGAVHARLDLGVARWLPGEVKVTSVLFQEVDRQHQQPQDYLPKTVDGLPAADFLWFTPARSGVDPCEEFRQTHP